MGNAQSSPPPPPAPPVVQEADYPGSKPPQESVIPGKPVSPRTDGVSIAKSKECAKCSLEFAPGISTASVSLSRDFGAVRSCTKFEKDLKRVKAKEMTVRDFVGGIQSGGYMRSVSTGFCEEVRFPDEVVQKINTVDELVANLSSLTSVRIREVSGSGFSSDTKATIKPSIPLKMSFNGTDISIDTITIYHPCPLRIQDQQADAVISLNDPKDKSAKHIILIPITTGDSSSSSAQFFAKLASQLTNLELPNPATGQYSTTSVQTGKQWSLSNLFPINAVADKKGQVDAGYFVWEGMPILKKVLLASTPSIIEYGWRRATNDPPVTYIMLENALPVDPNDLASLIRSLPVTDPEEAIHEVLEPAVYKKGPPAGCGTPMREKMTNKETCDPFLNNAMFAKTNQFSSSQILDILFNVVLMLAVGIGAYIALVAVTRMYDVEYADFSKGVGKVMAAWAKSVGGSAVLSRRMASPMSSALAAVTAPLAAAAPGGNPAAALAAFKPPAMPATPAAALAAFAPPAVTAPITSAMTAPVASAVESVKVPTPTEVKKWGKVGTPYLNTGTQLTRRGGTTRLGRGHGGLTRRAVR